MQSNTPGDKPPRGVRSKRNGRSNKLERLQALALNERHLGITLGNRTLLWNQVPSLAGNVAARREIVVGDTEVIQLGIVRISPWKSAY